MCLLSFNHQPLLTQYRFHLVPRSAWHNTYIHSSANCGTSLTSLYAAPVLPTPISTHFSSLSRSRHPYFPILVVLLINLLPIHEIFQSNRGPIQVIANIPSPTSIMPKLIVLSVARFKASRVSRAPFGGLAGGRLLSPMKYC